MQQNHNKYFRNDHRIGERLFTGVY